MFLGNCRISYTSRDKLRNLSEQDYEEIRKRVPNLELPPYGERESWSGWDTRILDGEEMEFLTQRGLELEVSRIRGVVSDSPSKLLEQGVQMPNIAIVSVPNVALFEVQHVTWLENACTMELQRYLDDGWRILCVCPPNDQRRPDYILGRKEPK